MGAVSSCGSMEKMARQRAPVLCVSVPQIRFLRDFRLNVSVCRIHCYETCRIAEVMRCIAYCFKIVVQTGGMTDSECSLQQQAKTYPLPLSGRMYSCKLLSSLRLSLFISPRVFNRAQWRKEIRRAALRPAARQRPFNQNVPAAKKRLPLWKPLGRICAESVLSPTLTG